MDVLECSRRYPSTKRFVALCVQLHLQKFCIVLVAPGRYIALTFCCICRSFVQFWGSWHGRAGKAGRGNWMNRNTWQGKGS